MIEQKINILKKIALSIETFNHKSDQHKQSLTKTFLNYLKNNPYDTDIWVKFALVSHCLLRNDAQAIECLTTILTYNPGNIYVTMLLVIISEKIHPMSDDLFEQLSALQPSSKELLSLIEYQKAWYYLEKDEAIYRYTLENSLDLCGRFVWNLRALGTVYFLRNNIKAGRSLFEKALNNIQHVYSLQEYEQIGIINIDDFFNARLKGTHIMQPMVLMMIQALK